MTRPFPWTSSGGPSENERNWAAPKREQLQVLRWSDILKPDRINDPLGETIHLGRVKAMRSTTLCTSRVAFTPPSLGWSRVAARLWFDPARPTSMHVDSKHLCPPSED